jgi:ribose transport system substrate-binding protein
MCGCGDSRAPAPPEPTVREIEVRPSAEPAKPPAEPEAKPTVEPAARPPAEPAAKPSDGPKAEPGRTLRLAFVSNTAADFWRIARKGCEKAVEELGNVNLEFRMPADGTAAEQRRIIDDLTAKGIDGLAISPVDAANQTPMLNEVAKKTLLITHDSDAPESSRLCYIGTSNVDAGRLAGTLIKEAIPDGGDIMLFVGKKDAQNARERAEGIREALKDSNVKILDIRTDDVNMVRAKANVLDTLVKYPDIACLAGLWAYNGPAILNAVKESNKLGKVKIVCFDEQEETLQGVKDGHIHGTVVQQPYEFGYQSIKLIAQILSGDKSGIPENKLKIVPTKAIKKDNVDEFWTHLNKLLGKQEVSPD